MKDDDRDENKDTLTEASIAAGAKTADQEPITEFQKSSDIDEDAGIPHPEDPDADTLIEVDKNANGEPYLEGMKPKVTKRLLMLGEDCRQKRDDMMQKNKDYRGARDLLLDEMQRKGIHEYDLGSGETVSITEKFGIKITKNPTLEDIE